MGRNSLGNSVVAITGGGRGIGLALARELSARGARVALGDIDAALAEKAAAALGGWGGVLDVRSQTSFAAFLAAAERALGPVNVMVNNAGIMVMGPFEQESEAVTDAQIEINLRGVILGCKLALPGMLARGHGHIVNIASLAGVVPLPGSAVYCATKFAVRGLTQSLREEYRDRGVAFSAVLPSKISTELAAGTERAGRGVPSAAPEDVALAIVDALERRLPEVTVPRYLRGVPALLALAPQRAERAFRRAFGDRRMLDDLDRTARADYDRRVARLAGQEH